MTGPASPPRAAPSVLVTGATGYVGGRLAARLAADGHAVHAVVRPGPRADALARAQPALVLHRHDGTAADLLRIVADASPHTVFHLASLFLAQHVPDDVAPLIASNLTFGAQLAEAMASHGVRRLVNAGTSWQHFGGEAYRPVNLYAATKQAFEDLLAWHVDAHGLRLATLLLFDTYGPGDPRPKLVPMLWRAALAGAPLAMSPGGQLIDLVHVDDVADAFVRAAAALDGHDGSDASDGHDARGTPQDRATRTVRPAAPARYGVSSGRPTTLVELVAAFERATGLVLPVRWGERPYRPREVMVPWQGTVPVPGWSPRIPFETGIVGARPAPA